MTWLPALVLGTMVLGGLLLATSALDHTAAAIFCWWQSQKNIRAVQDRAEAASAAAEEAVTDAYLHPYTQLLLDGPVPQYVRMQQPASEEQQREQLGGRFSGKQAAPSSCRLA